MNRFAVRWGRHLAMAVGILTASAAWADTTLTVWCWDPNFNGATMKEAGARYAKSHPEVKLNIVDFAKTDLEQKLQTQLASGTSEGLPDIVLIEDYGAQKYLRSFPNAFVPIGDKVDLSGMAKYKIAAATVSGKAYSMPFDSGVAGLFYRSDYLAQAGYKASDLQDITWDQLVQIGEQVKAKTGHKLLDLDFNDAGYVRMMLQSAGSWYFTPDGKPSIANNPAFKAALTAYTKILRSDIYEPASGWTNYTGAFTSGKVAATTIGVWITGTLKANKDQSGKWGVAPVPKLAGVSGATHATNLGGSSWYLLASSSHQDAALDFLKQVWGKDADFYQKILVDQGAVGSLLAARQGKTYEAADPFFGGEKVWQNFSTWLAQVPGVNYGVYTNEVDAAVIAQLPGLAKGGSIDDAIKAIDAQVATQIQ
jgi:lactose/L-arabinose transport system substrate-binding protein